MIYVDLLVIADLFMNYLVLISTGIILNRLTKFKKVFLSSVIGCIPLLFLFIITNRFLLFILNFVFSIIMSIISFDFKDIIYTLKNSLYMYFISIFLAGSIYLINTTFFPKTNSNVLLMLCLIFFSPIITFIYLKSIKQIKNISSNYYKIDIYLKDKPKITMNAYLDTGNKLTDPFTKKPIILISKEKLKYELKRYLYVPYNTIDNHGLLKCFRPEKIYIDKIGYRKRLLIGLIDEVNIENADCILNQKLLERI